MQKIYGRNAVIEALKSDEREFIKLFIKEGSVGEKIKKIVEIATSKGIKIEYVPNKIFKTKYPINSQGVVLLLGKRKYFPIEEIIQFAEQNEEKPFILLLDRIQDVRNLGAIIRTAAAMGIHGIVIPRHHAAKITPEVERISEGNINKLLICETSNLKNEIMYLKDRGITIVGLDMNGETKLDEFRENVNGLALILGNESNGIRVGLLNECDFVINIPMERSVESLNVSVSFGIAAFYLRKIVK